MAAGTSQYDGISLKEGGGSLEQGLAEGAALATCRYIDQRAPVPCRSPDFVPTPFRPVIFAESSSDYVTELQAPGRSPCSVAVRTHVDHGRWRLYA